MKAMVSPKGQPAHEGASQAAIYGRRLRRNRLMLVGGLLLLITIGMAIFGPILYPTDPLLVDLTQKLLPPGAGHPLGTDNFGRDIFARTLHGARSSLIVSALAVGFALAAGTLLGLLSGFVGGWFDAVVQRLVDVALAFPGLLLALTLMAVLGPGELSVILALGIGGIPGLTRLVRGQVLTVREREYVEAARALGAPSSRQMLKHILPNIISPILVVATLGAAGAIQAMAALSFLGLGVPAPAPTWGGMIADGQSFLFVAWWMPTFPGLAIAVAVLGFNLFGEGVGDLINPRYRR